MEYLIIMLFINQEKVFKKYLKKLERLNNEKIINKLKKKHYSFMSIFMNLMKKKLIY